MGEQETLKLNIFLNSKALADTENKRQCYCRGITV